MTLLNFQLLLSNSHSLFRNKDPPKTFFHLVITFFLESWPKEDPFLLGVAWMTGKVRNTFATWEPLIILLYIVGFPIQLRKRCYFPSWALSVCWEQEIGIHFNHLKGLFFDSNEKRKTKGRKAKSRLRPRDGYEFEWGEICTNSWST